jgi:hypothetical protein
MAKLKYWPVRAMVCPLGSKATASEIDYLFGVS